MKTAPTRAWEAAAAAALLGLFLVAAGAALRADSSVADEHPHILSGWLYWHSGRFGGGLDNPPLGQLLVAAPLVLLHRAYEFPSDTDLFWCRIPVLLCGAGLLLLLWRFGRALGGPWVGLAALAAAALEPNLLAHAHLATLDLPVTFLWWATLWAWREAERHQAPWRSRWGAGGAVLFAAATLTKFTGSFLLPAFVLMQVGAVRRAPSRRRSGGILGLAVVVLWLAAWLAYGLGPSHFGLPARLVAGLAGKLAHRQEVHFAYLAGHRSQSGFAAYFVAAMLLKTPLPLLTLAACGGVVLWRRNARRDLAWLVVPALVVVVAFSLIRVDVGVRHVLPAYPALVLLAAVGAVALAGAGRRARLVLVVLAISWAGGVARVAPQWLAYFNVLAGGPAGGHRWLLDSNLDWGQDEHRLQRFLQRAAARGETWVVDPDPETPRTGRLAVSANALHNLQRRNARPYAWLADLRPVGFAGFSWRLYDLQEADFARAAAARPGRAAAPAAYAEVLAARGDVAASRAVLEAAAQRLAGQPEFLELAVFAAQGAARRAAWEESAAWARRGLALRPDAPDLLGLAQVASLERTIAAPDSIGAARAGLELGSLWGELGQLGRALPVLQHAAAILRSDPEAQRAYAVALAQQGEYEAAMRVLDSEAARGHFPEELQECRTLATVASALAHGGVRIEPDVLLQFGQAAFAAGRLDAAAGAFTQALRERPDDGVALAYLCEIQVRWKLRLADVRLTPRAILPEAPAAARP